MMTIPEMKQALQHCADDYTAALQAADKETLISEIIRLKLGHGICNWLLRNYTVDFHDLILELSAEKPLSVATGDYAYPAPYEMYRQKNVNSEDIKTQCLQPRLDLLNATIARLENETTTANTPTP